MKKVFSTYSGIIIGACYGLALRYFIFGELKNSFSFTDLFSITFVWIVPVLIGITPFIFATSDQLNSRLYRALIPLITIFLFFIFCFITRIEDVLCIIIISLPFMLGGLVAGLIFGEILSRYKSRKGILYSFLLIPVFAGMIEDQFKIPTGVYSVKNKIIINNTPNKIWKNVVRVKDISKDEYSMSFFNYAGVPRPLYAELNKDGIGAQRIGHFEGGLIFNETVNDWELNKKVSFNIKVISSSIRQTVFDQHILKGQHFKFLNASYELTKISDSQTMLTLSSTYRLDTRINIYASFWGNILLSDFQQRLLEVIKHRCENLPLAE